MSSINPSNFNKRLGAAVRASRVVCGLTQSNVGEDLGVTFQQIQKYERGVNRLSVETLVRVAALLKTTRRNSLIPHPQLMRQAKTRRSSPTIAVIA